MTPIIFLLMYAISLAMSMVRPVWAIYAYSLIFYFSPHRTWWQDMVPDFRYLQTIAIVGILSSIFHGYWRAERFARLGAEFKLFASLVFLICIASAWAITGDLHADGRELFLKHLLITLLMILVIDSFEEIRNVLLVHVLGGLWLGYQAYGKSGGRLEGLAGALGDANTLGMHMSALAILAGFMFLGSARQYRWLSFLALPLIINTVVLTGSRGATVGLVAGGLVAGYLCPKRIRGKFMVAGVLGVIMIFMLSDAKYLERLATVIALQGGGAEEINRTSGSRWDIGMAGVEMWKDNPAGVGYKGTNFLSPAYMEEHMLTRGGRRSAHNSLLAILVDFGLVGLMLYLLMHARLVLRIRSINRTLQPEETEAGAMLAGMGGVLGIVVISGQTSNYYHAEIQYWMLALITVMYNLRQQDAMTAQAAAEEAEAAVSNTPIPDQARQTHQ